MFGTLRYILASLVVLTHLGPIELKYTGYYSVLCFFTLSGYLLGLAYQRYGDAAQVQTYARFYLNRLLRVFPAYALALIVTIITVFYYPVIASEAHVLITMPQSIEHWATNIMVINKGTLTGVLPSSLLIPSSWSLGVELFFWLILPAMFVNRKALLIWLVFSLCVLGVFYGIELPIHLRYFSAVGASVSFALGAWLFSYKIPERGSRGLSAILIALSVIYYVGSLYVFEDPFLWGMFGAVFVNAVLIYAFATFYGAQVPQWFKYTDRLLGDLSYSIFLIHITAGILVLVFIPDVFEFRTWAFFWASLAVSNVMAFLIWRFGEVPFETVRTRLRGKPKIQS
jgi:peptidoglycan/LPS O-acetylase OafA/YrhL